MDAITIQPTSVPAGSPEGRSGRPLAAFARASDNSQVESQGGVRGFTRVRIREQRIEDVVRNPLTAGCGAEMDLKNANRPTTSTTWRPLREFARVGLRYSLQQIRHHRER